MIHVIAELLATLEMSELLERLGLYLPYALAGNVEV
jgi:hypothetical protein